MIVDKLRLPACFEALLLSLAAVAGVIPASAQTGFTGGFIEQPHTAEIRTRPTVAQIRNFLPARGAFTFPAPYHTQGIRITNASDCNGHDCVRPVGYSYWRNSNNHIGSDVMLIFLGLDRNRGGSGPTLFSYNKLTDEVLNLGPLFNDSSPLGHVSGEGWYFSGTQPTKLYVNDGPRMLRYDVLSRQFETVFDVSTRFGNDYDIWQMHSSHDDRVHSATLRRTEAVGCIIYHENTAQFQYFPKAGDFDECYIDKSGRWLISLEDTDGLGGLEMRVIDIDSGANLLSGIGDPIATSTELIAAGVERLVYDQSGAVGHYDMGYGYTVGSDNWNSMPNAHLVWDLANEPLYGSLVFHNNDWTVPAANHISHSNARPALPVNQQYACASTASRIDSPWSNEVICFRLDGSLDVLVAAPVMTDMNSPVGGDNYEKEPKGNLDVTGQYFIWTSNTGGQRVDAFLVKVPAHVLAGGQPIIPPRSTRRSATGGGGASGLIFLSVLLCLVPVRRRRTNPIKPD